MNILRRIHPAWRVCLGCAILFFCTSGLVTNAFTIYFPYILSWNDFTGTQNSMIITVRTLAGFISMFLTGYYYRYLSLRKGMILSGIMVSFAFILFGLARSYPMYLTAAAIIGFGYGFGSMVPIGIILNHWFITDLSLATGICSCVTGLSTLGIPTLITVLIGRFGLYRTFWMEAGLILILITVSGFLIQDSPEKANTQPYSHSDGRNRKAKINKKLAIHRHLTGKSWIFLLPMLLLLGSITSTAYSHLTVLMTAEGITETGASVVMLLSGLVIVASKLLYGFIAGRVGAYITNYCFGIFTFIGLMLTAFAHDSLLIMGLAICIYSLGLGMLTVGLVVWAKDLSHEQDFDANNRRIQVGYIAGGLLFSPLPGIMADHFGGSYVPAFIMFSAAALIVLIIIQGIYIYAMKSA